MSLTEFAPQGGGRAWRRWVAVLVFVALVAGAVWLVWFSSVLTVRQVRVVGVADKAAERVQATAQVATGMPLARVDTEAVAARVRDIDWVEGVEVRRGWPSEVVLAVVPRTAVAVQQGTEAGVDATGVAFTPPTPLAKGLPVIDATDVALREAVRVYTGLPPDLAGRVTSMRASTRDDVSFTFRNGALVRWGSADQAAVKAQVLQALLSRRARMYDVTAPSLPTTFDEHPRRSNS